MKMNPTSTQQSKLLPLSQIGNPAKEEQEEYCECVDPVAKKEVRQSAEFKMRILSKKKATLKNQTRLVCENCGATIRHTLHGSYSLTTVSKDQAKRSSH